MDSILPILGGLLALVTPGYSMTCFECYSITNAACTGPATECSSGICMSGLITISEYSLFGRACAPSEYSCGIIGTMTSPSGGMQLSTSCCRTDNCTPEVLDVPTRSPLINGVACSTDPTDQTRTIECTGNEAYCANVEFTTMGPSVGPRLHGCATNSICSFENQTFDINGTVYHLGIACGSPPGLHLHHCFLFLILAVCLKYH